ncbi:MAG TPA: filamentous hemagglutinin family protein, partial [Rhodospirillales bacterium]|nr:filamentous hemagglutinin family protein [Rhodospirillales bacterium]
ITFVVENLGSTIGELRPVPAGGSFVIGGPGTFILDAGRNLDLRPSRPEERNPFDPNQITVSSRQFGVLAVGNRINPYRAAESADLMLLFGTAPGKDIAAFIDRYLDPANAGGVETTYIDDVLDFMQVRAAALGTPATFTTPEQALAAFRALPEDEQLPLIARVYFDELRSIIPGPDAAFTVNQRRAFEAVATLFPASLGYTDQFASPVQPVRTGNFDMVNALVRTDYGSSITFMGPGGDAQIGGFTVDAALPLNFQGIFTLRGGTIEAALDGSYNVNNSRVITAQGGDITVFSANGDIDAGRGAKTASFSPPINCVYTDNTSCSVDFGGIITGSGIGTLVTLPGGEIGDVFLIAPRGTVDAGEGGIRAAGNLAIVAVQVLNATNVQVGGASVGLPQAAASPAGALQSSQGTQAALGSQALEQIATAAGAQSAADGLPSIVTVEVLSFGE